MSELPDLPNPGVHILGYWSNSWAGPTTSIAVELQENLVMFDVGIDPIGRLRSFGLDPTRLSNVFLSHCHSDHISGFANLVFTRNTLSKRRGDEIDQLSVIGDQSTLKAASSLLEIQYPERSFDVAWIPVNPSNEYRMPALGAMRFKETDHTVPGLSARLDAIAGWSVGFQADTRPEEGDVEFFAGVDILVAESFSVESASAESTHKRGHSTLVDAARLAESCSVGTVVPYHLPDRYSEVSVRQLANGIFSDAGVSSVLPDGITSVLVEKA